MYKISKEFHFSASHQLTGLPESHPCSRIHGHNYVVTFHLKAENLDEIGMVQDYRELAPVKEFIDNQWDHRHLNDKLIIGHYGNALSVDELKEDTVGLHYLNPTAENMAIYLYLRFKSRIPLLYAVSVKETPKTEARYEP